MVVILVDGSYYVFYRFYAVWSWWKRSHPEEPLTDPITSEAFVSTFKNTFPKHIKNFIKTFHLSASGYKLIVAKDCPQKDIWRQTLMDGYKGTRDHSNFKGGPFFEMAYEGGLFESIGATIVGHPHLEADDCIACLARYYELGGQKVYILANDHDYMQLISDYVEVYTLTLAALANHKNFYGSAKKALFMKILLGDKSDNIPPVFKKCGPKTAERYYTNSHLLQKKLEEDEEAKTQLETNQRIIDFTHIPSELMKEFMHKIEIE